MKITEVAFTGYPVADIVRAGDIKFVVEPFENPACRMAIIADPDGNSICLHKRHPGKN